MWSWGNTQVFTGPDHGLSGSAPSFPSAPFSPPLSSLPLPDPNLQNLPCLPPVASSPAPSLPLPGAEPLVPVFLPLDLKNALGAALDSIRAAGGGGSNNQSSAASIGIPTTEASTQVAVPPALGSVHANSACGGAVSTGAVENVNSVVNTASDASYTPGEVVRYWSKNRNQWICAMVKSACLDASGAIVAYDLDCKHGVPVSRVRRPSKALDGTHPGSDEQEFSVGEHVRYWSQTHAKWVDVRVQRVHRNSEGRVLAYDLTAKANADVSRVRPASWPADAPAPAPLPKRGASDAQQSNAGCVSELLSPPYGGGANESAAYAVCTNSASTGSTNPGAVNGSAPQTAEDQVQEGPLCFAVGEHVKYLSESKGRWVEGVVLSRYEVNGTLMYDLNCKRGTRAEQLQPTVGSFQPGAKVEYWSTSTHRWVPACLVRINRHTDRCDLDIKRGAFLGRIRRMQSPVEAGSSGLVDSGAAEDKGSASTAPAAVLGGPDNVKAKGELAGVPAATSPGVDTQSVTQRSAEAVKEASDKKSVAAPQSSTADTELSTRTLNSSSTKAQLASELASKPNVDSNTKMDLSLRQKHTPELSMKAAAAATAAAATVAAPVPAKVRAGAERDAIAAPESESSLEAQAKALAAARKEEDEWEKWKAQREKTRHRSRRTREDQAPKVQANEVSDAQREPLHDVLPQAPVQPLPRIQRSRSRSRRRSTHESRTTFGATEGRKEVVLRPAKHIRESEKADKKSSKAHKQTEPKIPTASTCKTQEKPERKSPNKGRRRRRKRSSSSSASHRNRKNRADDRMHKRSRSNDSGHGGRRRLQRAGNFSSGPATPSQNSLVDGQVHTQLPPAVQPPNCMLPPPGMMHAPSVSMQAHLGMMQSSPVMLQAAHAMPFGATGEMPCAFDFRARFPPPPPPPSQSSPWGALPPPPAPVRAG